MAPSNRNKLAITSPTSGGRSVGIVRSQTQTMEFGFFRWVDNIKMDLLEIEWGVPILWAVDNLLLQRNY
jgi:hypothetical protein